MIRATTGGVLRSYRKNLMNSFITDNKARETVLTQRVFNSYAEDPAAAAKAFRLRKSRMQTSSQLRVCDDTYHKYQSAFQCLQTVSELIDTENSSSDVSTLKDCALRMLNDPTGDARTQLNKVLDNLSDTIIQQMNQTYGDEFIFAGADGHNVPFTVEEVDGQKKLYYRGVSVDAQDPNAWKDASGQPIEVTVDGKVPTAGVATGRYLKMGNTKIMSINDYNALHAEPVVVMTASTTVGVPDTPTEYNGDGTVKADGDGKDGGYYMRADAAGNATGELVSVNDYNEELHRFQNPAQCLEENIPTGGKVLVDENGVPTAGGKYYVVFDGEPETIDKATYEKEKLEADKLKYLANEKRLVDIGLGFQEDGAGKIIESSAFNESLPGLQFLGYGLDAEGDPKNLYSIVQRLKDIAANAPDEGKWSKEIYDEFDRMVGKLENASSEYKTQFTNQSAGTEKLKNCYDLLEDNVYNLKEQYSNLEDVNMADAITSFIWAEYCYNAALKVGNSILSQSLMDYLQ